MIEELKDTAKRYREEAKRVFVESGQSPDEIATALRQAQAEGQGNFTVADALGNSGQRTLSSVARTPGEGRTNVGRARTACLERS